MTITPFTRPGATTRMEGQSFHRGWTPRSVAASRLPDSTQGRKSTGPNQPTIGRNLIGWLIVSLMLDHGELGAAKERTQHRCYAKKQRTALGLATVRVWRERASPLLFGRE